MSVSAAADVSLKVIGKQRLAGGVHASCLESTIVEFDELKLVEDHIGETLVCCDSPCVSPRLSIKLH